MDFKIKVYIPSIDKFDYINELKNRETLAISKYIKANDDYGLSNYFNNLLSGIPATNIADKFFILCQLRALNLSNSIIINGKHISGDDATYKINLFSFLEKYLKYINKLNSEQIYTNEELEIHFKLPKDVFFKNFYALLNDIIFKIVINGEDVLLNKTPSQKFNIITQLNKTVISEFKSHLETINNSSELFFIQPTEEILVPTIKISFFNNTIFSILKSIFKTEISYFYNKFYISLTKLGLSFDDFLKLSYVETDILLNIYKSVNKLK